VRATFFQCGANVRRLPEVSREVAAAGHEIGNHTDTHTGLYLKSPDFIYRELRRLEIAYRRPTGVRPGLFRAPYGARWFGLRDAQRRLGLMGVMWSNLGAGLEMAGCKSVAAARKGRAKMGPFSACMMGAGSKGGRISE